MELTERDIKLFDNYRQEQMAPEEKAAFEKKLREDAAYKELFEQYKLLAEGIRWAGREALKKHIAKEGEVKYIQNLWGRKGTIAAAAVLLIFTAMFFVIETIQNRLVLSETHQEKIALEEENRALPEKKDKKLLAQSENKNQPDSEAETLNTTEANIAEELDDIEFLEDTEHEDREIAHADTEKAEDSDTLTTDLALAETARIMQESMLAPPATQASSAQKENSEYKISQPFLLLDSVFRAVVIKQEILTGDTDTAFTSDFQQIQLQFWKSPLNSKTYKYTGQKGKILLEIYGIDPSAVRKIFYLDGEIIFLSQNIAYRFNPTQTYLPLKTDTNKDFISLLEKLNEN